MGVPTLWGHLVSHLSSMTVDQSQLHTQAWQMLQEVMQSGVMTLPNGKVYELDDAGMLKVVQWLTSKSAKTRKLVPLPEEFLKGRQ